MNIDRQIEIWKSLIENKSLDGLCQTRANGRVDLSGLVVPEPAVLGQIRVGGETVKQLAGLLWFRGVRWENLDFTGSRLRSLRFTDCKLGNCVFDLCDCQDWRLWATHVADTSFASADLRRSSLGGVEEGKRNRFRAVSFARADLRLIACRSAEFIGCEFKGTKLDKVDFQGSSFVDCGFEGELNEVLFHRHAFRGEDLPPNEMTRVDFTRAKLRFVEFRNLDMETARFPANDDHVILNDYRTTLDKLLTALDHRDDITSKRLKTDLAMLRKWAGPRQRRGVLSKADVREMAGEHGLRQLLDLLRTTAELQ